MDIAALSMITHQASLSQQVSVSVLDKALESSEIDCAALIKMMEQSVTPYLGSNIDVRV